MPKSTIPSKTMLEILYGLENIKAHFGTDEVDYDMVVEYQAKRFESWAANEITIPYTHENIKTLLREEKKLGLFTVIHRVKSSRDKFDTPISSTIAVRAEKPEDLAFLLLKYKWN